jgi:hypothetical protein
VTTADTTFTFPGAVAPVPVFAYTNVLHATTLDVAAVGGSVLSRLLSVSGPPPQREVSHAARLWLRVKVGDRVLPVFLLLRVLCM